jgi:ABC-type sugar transport system ATPase subunit
LVLWNYELYSNVTVYANIRFPLRVIRKVRCLSPYAQVRRAAAIVELSALLQRRPRGL